MTFFAAFAQFERELMQERTRDGVARARSWGKIVGRHPVDCGRGLKTGKFRHNGLRKPIRDEKNRIIGWKQPEPEKTEPGPVLEAKKEIDGGGGVTSL
jgi:DNA invertase Pin-like site-specific DNA recombinase